MSSCNIAIITSHLQAIIAKLNFQYSPTYHTVHLYMYMCRGFESHLRQLSFSFFHCLRCLSFFLSFYISDNIMYNVCPVLDIYILLELHVHVYELFDLDTASWAALVAQLVRASVRSAECHGFKFHLRQLIFHCFLCLRCLSSFFLSFHLMSSCISSTYMYMYTCMFSNHGFNSSTPALPSKTFHTTM